MAMPLRMSASGTSQGSHNVFVYGSLLADEVVQVLLNRVPSSSPATLPDYNRFSIKGRVYPAILPVENKKVLGRVCVFILEVSVLYPEDNLEKLQAYAYVWDNKNDPDLYEDWDFEKWKVAHMKDFIEMTKEFVEEVEHPESKSRVETYNSFYQSGEP
ncbi:AIG2-like protein D isoform X2 [Spinacia oleracea]|uniref:Putative gamma-glutamylcyclotransferase n=1 Tax=Spinacia oleracea TaxID=3562 RepID=A0A9R0JRL0_SPIOL|nr:AIG2-like protein D isoform X2 [Spinacia oleracea]